MNSIGTNNTAAMVHLPVTLPLRGAAAEPSLGPSLQGKGKNGELRERFTQFVGEAFFGQMLKAMRSTVGKPAYFYGGRAEEVFQGQLDQTMAEHLTKASASKLAEPMFERQFPQMSDANSTGDLNDLSQLRRQ